MVKNNKGKKKDIVDRLNEFGSTEIKFRKLKKASEVSEEEIDKAISRPVRLPVDKKAIFNEKVQKAKQLEDSGMMTSANRLKREAYVIMVNATTKK